MAFLFTAAGAVAAVAAFVALWRLPVYASSGPGGTSRHTLAEVNGDWVLALAATPVAVALIAWIGLYLTCSRGSAAGHAVAGVAVGLLGTLALLGMASIGMFLILPAGLLCVAVVLTPRGACGAAPG